jgi:hypothetical protein
MMVDSGCPALATRVLGYNRIGTYLPMGDRVMISERYLTLKIDISLAGQEAPS